MSSLLSSSFAKLNILVIGDVMLDSYIWGHVERMSPEADVPVLLVDKKENRLGGAANVAVNLRALGVHTFLMGIVGDDDAGRLLKEKLNEHQINASALLVDKSRCTTEKQRLINVQSHLLRADRESTNEISNSIEKELLQQLDHLLAKEKIDACILQDYNKGLLTASLIEQIIKKCKANDVLVTVDPKRKNFFTYKMVDLFKPNWKECQEALDLSADYSQEQVIKAATTLQEQLQAAHIFITLSSNGVYYTDQAQAHFIPAHERDVIDVSGAGDSVIAVCTAALAAAMPMREAARLANLAGGLVCEKAGVVSIELYDLEQEYQRINS